jgi:hypothetical protein
VPLRAFSVVKILRMWKYASIHGKRLHAERLNLVHSAEKEKELPFLINS